MYKIATSDDVISNYHLYRNIPELRATGPFTKWVEAYPMTSQVTQTVAELYTCPRVHQSLQGAFTDPHRSGTEF